jgi:predicted  nucleic acid-binding Zn-ribbon protein
MMESKQRPPEDCPVRSGELSELRQYVRSVHEKVDDLRSLVGSLVEELKKLTKLEIDHSYTRAEVTQLTSSIENLRLDIKGIDVRLESRIAAIERDMPGLVELRKRVLGAVWSLTGIVATAVLAWTLLRGRPD